MKYLIVLLFVCSFAVNLYAVDVSWGTITEHNHDQVLAIQEQNNMPDKKFFNYVLGKKPTPPGFEFHSLTAEYPDHAIGKGKGIDLTLTKPSSSSQNTIVVGAGFGAFCSAEFFIKYSKAYLLREFISEDSEIFFISMIAIKSEYTNTNLFKNFLNKFVEIAESKATAALIIVKEGNAAQFRDLIETRFTVKQIVQNHFERPGGGYVDGHVYMKTFNEKGTNLDRILDNNGVFKPPKKIRSKRKKNQ